MPQFKVTRKAYGPKTPGAPHELLEIGAIVEADTKPGSAYEPLDKGEAAASPAAVRSARKRAAAAAQAGDDAGED